MLKLSGYSIKGLKVNGFPLISYLDIASRSLIERTKQYSVVLDKSSKFNFKLEEYIIQKKDIITFDSIVLNDKDIYTITFEDGNSYTGRIITIRGVFMTLDTSKDLQTDVRTLNLNNNITIKAAD